MKRTDKDEAAAPGRRAFLKLATVAGPAAAAAAATGAPEAAEAAETAGEGLRKTAHVKAYLDSARF